MKTEMEKLRKIVAEKAVLKGEFILSSGLKTDRYYDFKRVILDSEGIYLAGKKVFELIAKEKITVVGGYGIGGSILVIAVLVTSWLKSDPFFGFIVEDRSNLREDNPKKYKDITQKYIIEGYLPPIGSSLALVDDVISTGKDITKLIEVVESKGRKVAKIVTLFDRHLGGSEKLKSAGYNFTALFEADKQGNIQININ